MKTLKFQAALAMLVVMSVSVWAEDTPAKFQVTPKVINPGLEGFTATVGRIGNTASWGVGSSFEPVQWRDKIFATQDHPHAIIADESAVSAHDRLREGALDGADIMVFRVIDGKMTLVRRDQVREGGHAASGWRRIMKSTTLIAPDHQRMEGGFEGWNRADTDYWFTVVAVDKEGRESDPSNAVHFKRRAKPGKPATENETVEFKAPRRARRGQAPSAPQDLRVRENKGNGDAILEWTGVEHPNLAGYRILRSDYDPAKHRGFQLELASSDPSSEAIKAGDMVFLHKTIVNPSRKELLTNRVFDSHHRRDIQIDLGPQFFPDEDPNMSWRLEPHSADTPVDNPGETFLKMVMTGEDKHKFARYAFGDTQQSSRWWPVLNPAKEYVVEVWMRHDGMKEPTVQFSLGGQYRRDMKPIEFTVSNEWQKHTATFQVPFLLDSAGHVGEMVLTFEGPGTLSMDNYRVYEKGTPYLALIPEDVDELKNSKMSALRSHQFIKTKRNTYNMDQLTNEAGAINGTNGNTLPQFLNILETVDMRPWLQIEFFTTPEEWQGFVEYMAAPYDPKVDSPKTKPWAAKRFNQGREKPWTEAFDRIYFEIGNETWNNLFKPWTFENMRDAKTNRNHDRGTVYGLFQEWVIDQLHSSPYWSDALDKQFEFVIGGWATQQNESGYGARAIAASPRSRHMTIAAYNGGWDEGEGAATVNNESFQRILMHAAQTGAQRAQAFMATHKKQNLDYELGVYEAGPGYVMSGLNNHKKMTPEQVEEQARAMKSLAAGTATLDTFLAKAENGFKLNNFFTWSRSRNHWHSHAQWHDGGQAYPSWMAISLFNQHGTGDMLEVKTAIAPTIDMPEFHRRKAASDLPLVASYATRNGDRLSVFVISRKLDVPGGDQDGFTPVEITLPITNAKKMTLHRMSNDPRAHNLDDESVTVESIEIDNQWIGPRLAINTDTGGYEKGIPPASVYLYVFEGVEFTPEEKRPEPKQAGMVNTLLNLWTSFRGK